MSRHTDEFVQAHNRPLRDHIEGLDGGFERLCMKCFQWMHVKEYVLTHRKPGYICKSCDSEDHRIRERDRRAASIRGMHRLPRVTNEPQFNEAKVDVAGLRRFASMPTPEQLLARIAA